jgi:glycosyltransferase involved in cell wall biosynthesis
LSEYDKTEIDFLNAVSEIVVMNSSDEMNLEKHGIDKPTKSVCYGAISDDIFFPSKSLDNDKFVYVSGDVKLRKNPSKILEVMEKNPEIKFVVFGNNWRLYLLQESPHLPNVKWAAGSLKDSGFYMQKAHCYLSLSDLEGGPYGTIEALSSGTPVVCTPTGWNPEIINNENGVIVGFDANVSMIRQAIERAFEIKKTIYDRNVLNPIFNFPRQSRVLFKEN